MNVLKINAHNPEASAIEEAVKSLRNEEVIIHPTETVYGLACLYSSEKALNRVFEIKQRPQQQPFSIMVNKIDDILEISGVNADWLRPFLEKIFPGAVTVLLPRRNRLFPAFWNQFPLIGFRFPDHKLSMLLLAGTNQPIITTSANLSGGPSPGSVEAIPVSVLEKAALILDGGETEHKIPSTIIRIDIDGKNISLARQGAYSFDEIRNYFVNS